MKKSLLILLAGLLFSLFSCKKTYTCNCNTSYTYKGSSGSYFTIIIPANKTPYSQKMNLKKANSACKHEQFAIQTNFTSAITDNGKYPLTTGESIVASCAITL